MAIARHADIRPFYNPYTIAALAVASLAILCLALNADDDRSGFTWLYLIGVVQLLPMVICITRRSYNYLAFVMLNHFMVFTYAKFNRVAQIEKSATLHPWTQNAIHELMLPTILMGISYYTWRMLIFRGHSEKERYQSLTLTRTQLALAAIYVITVPVSIDYLPAFFMTIHFALVSAYTLILLGSTCPGHPMFARFVAILLPLSTFVYYVRTGFLSFMGQYGGFLVVAALLRRKKRDFVSIAVLVVFVSALQTIKSEYRAFIQVSENVPTYGERLAFIGEVLYRKYIDPVEEQARDEEENEVDRSGQLLKGFDRLGDDSLERVLALTPSVEPFWEGSSYESIPYMFIPRFLWAEKPSRHFWNRFGRVYGILAENDYLTSVGVGYFAEAYMNYGFTGMYLCAIFMGLLIVVFERISFVYLHGHFLFSFIVFLGPLMAFGSDMGSMLNSMVILTCALYFVRNILVRMARRDEYA